MPNCREELRRFAESTLSPNGVVGQIRTVRDRSFSEISPPNGGSACQSQVLVFGFIGPVSFRVSKSAFVSAARYHASWEAFDVIADLTWSGQPDAIPVAQNVLKSPPQLTDSVRSPHDKRVE